MRPRTKMLVLSVSLLLAAGAVPGEAPAAAAEGHDSTFIDVTRDSRKITVRPTGFDDTANIRWALENVAPGGVVRLDAGHFIVTKSTIVEPSEIDASGNPNAINSDVGVFTGLAADKTTVEARRKFNGSGFEITALPNQQLAHYSTMFNFARPAYPLTIQNMTLKVGHINITDPYPSPFNGEPTTGMLNTLAVGGLYFDEGFPKFDTPVVLKNLVVTGLDRLTEFTSDEEYYATWYSRKNQHYGLITISMTDVTITNCHVDHSSGDAIEIMASVENGKATIKNSSVAHGAAIGLYGADAAQSGDIVVKDTTLIDIFHDHPGIQVVGWHYVEPWPASNVVIKDNDFSQIGKTEGYVVLQSWGAPVTGTVVKIEDCNWVLDLSGGPNTCRD